MYDIVSVGSATVDIFLSSDKFNLDSQGKESLTLNGSKINVGSRQMVVGGGGTNTATGFSRLGFKTAGVARFGHDWFGDWLKANLSKEKFDQQFLLSVENEETDLSVILLSDRGERVILTSRGQTRLDQKTFPWPVVKETAWLYLSSLEGNLDLLEDILDHLKDINSPKIAFNPGILELTNQDRLKKILPQIKLLILNEEEAKFFWGNDFTSQIKSSGPEMIALTAGAKGASLFTQDEVLTQAAWPTRVVDTTGAGDAFAVGLLSGLMRGFSLNKSLSAGLAESASVISHIGAKEGLLTQEELASLLAKH